MNAEEFQNIKQELRTFTEIYVEIKEKNPEFSERMIGFKLGYEFASMFRKQT